MSIDDVHSFCSIISEHPDLQGTLFGNELPGFAKQAENFDIGTDLNNQKHYIIQGRITAIFASQLARITMKLGVRFS